LCQKASSQCDVKFTADTYATADTVAASLVALRWLCDSPRTGCAWRITPLYMWHEQAIIEWSWHVNSIAACCHSAKLCAYAARDFRSQQYVGNDFPLLLSTIRNLLLFLPSYLIINIHRLLSSISTLPSGVLTFYDILAQMLSPFRVRHDEDNYIWLSKCWQVFQSVWRFNSSRAWLMYCLLKSWRLRKLKIVSFLWERLPVGPFSIIYCTLHLAAILDVVSLLFIAE